ncbi:MAG: glutamine--fructose-6-phosphate transaminase (isomerizing) [Acidobacteria bacterium]|nr:MAG: glutamine--fructose-6-phosphate transaminase (isomerizing) [Acidobacteriota bacterium]
MCGIVGYVGGRNATAILVEGLKRLEYRGYDSAGLALLVDGRFELRRAAGKLRDLEKVLESEPVASSRQGIGHTRWATHGRPTEENAHPHRDADDRVVVVHNGIIENYLELKEELTREGDTFRSETDSEVIAHLIARELRAGEVGLEEAVRRTCKRLAGIYAFCAMSLEEPGRIVGARLGPPLVIGLGDGENFLASDVMALLEHTRDVVFLKDGEVAAITPEGATVTGADGAPKKLEVQRISWSPILAEKGGYRHFMLKEIHEQPHAIQETLAGRISLDRGEVFFSEEEFPLDDSDLREIDRVYLVACGTSWHAGLVGKFLFERLARIPTEVDYASEFRYRDPLVDRRSLMTIVTQSGETADTLAALREARARGAKSVAVCNVMGSTATREADGTVLTHCGPEIGVASTKAFTAQLAALHLMALRIGVARGTLGREEVRRHLTELARLPALLEKVLEDEGPVQDLAKKFKDATDFLYLGRGINYPIALEGALKLKEISYIHAEGYPAGEMKHGPIALIDESLPVVALAPRDDVYEKMLGNMEEVKARGGVLIAVTTAGNGELRGKADHVIEVPEAPPLLLPALLVVPLQLLAYHIALLRGCDVDQPRNLAKSVTVE